MGLYLGAEVCGLSGIAHGLFARGPVELINHFNSLANEELAKILAEKVKVFPNCKA